MLILFFSTLRFQEARCGCFLRLSIRPLHVAFHCCSEICIRFNGTSRSSIVHLWKAYVTARCAIASSTRNRTRVSDPRDTPADSPRAIDARNRCNSIFISERLRIVRTSLIFVQRVILQIADGSQKARSFFGFGKHPADPRCFKRIRDPLETRSAPGETIPPRISLFPRAAISAASSPPFPPFPRGRLPQPQFRNLHSRLPRIRLYAVI